MHAALGEPVRLAIVDQLILGDAAPGELAARFGLATNLLAFHLGVLDQAGLVRRVRSEGDRRRQYVQLRLNDPGVAAIIRPVPIDTDSSLELVHALGDAGRVVFVCTANSARSQLAAATWHRITSIPVDSAGTHPADRVHPRAIEVARRHRLDLGNATTRSVQNVRRLDADGESRSLLVAVCDNAHEELLRDGGQRRGPDWLHWHIPDPAPVNTDEAFEDAYTQISERVSRLAAVLTEWRIAC